MHLSTGSLFVLTTRHGNVYKCPKAWTFLWSLSVDVVLASGWVVVLLFSMVGLRSGREFDVETTILTGMGFL